MNKRYVMILIAILVLGMSVTGVLAQRAVYSDLPDLEGQVVTVAVENLYAPFQFEDPRADAPIGFDYDLINEICNRLNCVPEYQLTSWEVQMAAVGEGQYDLGVNGISIKPERMEVVQFSAPYVNQDIFLLARQDEDRFSNLEEFGANEDLLMGVISGGANYWMAQGYIEEGLMTADRVVEFNGFAEAVVALSNGDIDTIPADASSTGGFVNASGAPVELVGDVLASDEFGVIFPLDADPELVAAFNAAIESMREDGYLDYLAYKWLIRYTPPVAN